MSAQRSGTTSLQAFGGDWTEQKLTVIRDYLSAYTKALKNQNFDLYYIDAFAGTGYREIENADEPVSAGLAGLFPEQAEAEDEGLFDGSARLALQVVPPFDRLIFIEKSNKRLKELRSVVSSFPNTKERVDLVGGDCNEVIPTELGKIDWNKCRGVLFLDPFGMGVNWATMEVIAATHAIDVWVLFPVGVGVNRLLTQDLAKMPRRFAACLDRVFGTPAWRDEFYRKVVEESLFDTTEFMAKDCSCRKIVNFYLERLKTVFAGVNFNPRFLVNSRNSPMFALCFAMGNPTPKALGLALKLAKSVLRM